MKRILIAIPALIALCSSASALPYPKSADQADGTNVLQGKIGIDPPGTACRIEEFLPYKDTWNWKNLTGRNRPVQIRQHVLLLLPTSGKGEPLPIGVVEVRVLDKGAASTTTDGDDRNVGNDFTVTWTADPFPAIATLPTLNSINSQPLNQIQNTMESASIRNGRPQDARQNSRVSRYVHVELTGEDLKQCKVYDDACPCISVKQKK